MSETAIVRLAEEKERLFPALQGWAAALSNLEPEQMPAALDMARQMKNLSGEVHDKLRDKLLEAVKTNGQRVTEKGSLQDSVGGFKVTAIPTRTGTDPKKLEALLRSKKLEPTLAMDASITYAVNNTKLTAALVAGQVSPADVQACAYAPSYRVQVERE